MARGGERVPLATGAPAPSEHQPAQLNRPAETLGDGSGTWVNRLVRIATEDPDDDGVLLVDEAARQEHLIAPLQLHQVASRFRQRPTAQGVAEDPWMTERHPARRIRGQSIPTGA